MARSVHPFPARMAPDLAMAEFRGLSQRQVVLDPMSGSGTVLRAASESGHRAIGFDVDPLAVLMARVWTRPVHDADIATLAERALKLAQRKEWSLPWVDDDVETLEFTRYWFGLRQRRQLRRLAGALQTGMDPAARRSRACDVLRLALSRTIVTKDRGASLARDVSHSRPHRVCTSSDYDVFEGFERAVSSIRGVLRDEPPCPGVSVGFGDARKLKLGPSSVDVVITSPPYLNAIDYLRGHRLALVWLGHNLKSLRQIRAEAIGAERCRSSGEFGAGLVSIRDAMSSPDQLSSRLRGMVERYATDLLSLMAEIRRVIRPGGRAVLVVGNSCLRGVFVRNSAGVIAAAKCAGLDLEREVVRELPEAKRYLPLSRAADPALEKRMRTESVLSFAIASGK